MLAAEFVFCPGWRDRGCNGSGNSPTAPLPVDEWEKGGVGGEVGHLAMLCCFTQGHGEQNCHPGGLPLLSVDIICTMFSLTNTVIFCAFLGKKKSQILLSPLYF